MATTAEIDFLDVATAVIEQVNAQIDQPLTLATAIAGGVVAAALGVVVHNGNPANKAIRLGCQWLFLTGFILICLSIVGGYLAKSALSNATPILLQMPASNWTASGSPRPSSLNELMFDGSGALSFAISLQVWTFVLAIAALAAFVVMNKRLLPRA